MIGLACLLVVAGVMADRGAVVNEEGRPQWAMDPAVPWERASSGP